MEKGTPNTMWGSTEPRKWSPVPNGEKSCALPLGGLFSFHLTSRTTHGSPRKGKEAPRDIYRPLLFFSFSLFLFGHWLRWSASDDDDGIRQFLVFFTIAIIELTAIQIQLRKQFWISVNHCRILFPTKRFFFTGHRGRRRGQVIASSSSSSSFSLGLVFRPGDHLRCILYTAVEHIGPPQKIVAVQQKQKRTIFFGC